MKTTRLRVTLLEVEPVVIRVLDVPATVTLPELHELLQAGIGWTDSHLHQFVTGEVRYGAYDLDAMDDEHDEAGVLLSDLPGRFSYLYDFGDGWDHDVEVLGPGAGEPGCRYGEGNCPPEDCGGPSGFAELLAVLADPSHEDHRQLRDGLVNLSTSTWQPPIWRCDKRLAGYQQVFGCFLTSPVTG